MTGPSSTLSLTVNGRTYGVEGESTQLPLLEWLRRTGLTGSKQGCAEGDCGACTVALVERDAAGRPSYRAINSCIALLPMFHGREVVTVEGLAGAIPDDRLRTALADLPAYRDPDGVALHPVQQAMVRNYGSQCGYCTPGVIMTAKALLDANPNPTKEEIKQATAGNLCRCTGYQQIVEAIENAAEVLRKEAA